MADYKILNISTIKIAIKTGIVLIFLLFNFPAASRENIQGEKKYSSIM
jgi:hypothetical protein